MTRSQPAMMIFRTWEVENCIFEEPCLGFVEAVAVVLLARAFFGFACGSRYFDGTAQREIAQPLACELL